MQCVQGILNLAPNGPNDGGLIVLKGSSALNEQVFKEHETTDNTWGPADWFGFTAEQVAWFTSRGCEALKVCADPGDLILWDSRTVHYNTLPETDAIRSVLCKSRQSFPKGLTSSSPCYADICYTPASYAKKEDLEMKTKLFKDRIGTTHWPHANIFPNNRKQKRLGVEETYERTRPINEPEETPQILRLAGVEPYT
jgi:hypothetical protein